jgi:hypothetical protein
MLWLLSHIGQFRSPATSSEVAMPEKALLERIRAEYLEMPGLRLTVDQAQRLCGVERATCQAVFDALVRAHFLCVKPNGAYARLTEGASVRPRSGKAGKA